MLHQQKDMTKLSFVKTKLNFVLMSSRIPTFQIYVHLHLITNKNFKLNFDVGWAW